MRPLKFILTSEACRLDEVYAVNDRAENQTDLLSLCPISVLSERVWKRGEELSLWGVGQTPAVIPHAVFQSLTPFVSCAVLGR